MSYQTAGNAGLAVRVGSEVRSLGRKVRGDLKADPADVDGVRGIADQLLLSELHVGNGNATIIADTSGNAVATFRSSGAHNIGKTGQITTFDGSVTVAGDLIVSGTTTTFNTEVALFEDNTLVVNSAPGGAGYDSGILAKRYQPSGDSDAGDVIADAAALSNTLQSGGTSTTAKLNAGASASDDFYNGWWAQLSQTGHLMHNQARAVADYDGTTKVITVAAWTAVAGTGTMAISNATTTVTGTGTAFLTELAVGDSILVAAQTKQIVSIASDTSLVVNSVFTGILALQGFQVTGPGQLGFNLFNRPFVGSVYDESADLWAFVSTASDPGAGPIVITDYIGVRLGSLVSDDGITISAGGLTMTGQDIGAAGAEIGNIFMDGAIRFDAVAAPTPVANKGFAYTKLVSGNPELFWMDENGAEVQITAAGSVNASGSGGTLDSAYDFGGAGAGRSLTIDSGAIALSQAKTTENSGTFVISYAASAFTGTSHGIVVDMSGASSLSNGGNVYGVNLVGIANGGAGDSVGLNISGFDKGIANAGTYSQTAGAFTYNVGSAAFNVDCGTFSVDGVGPSNLSVTGNGLTLSTITSGTLAVTSAGALNLTSAAASTWAHSGGSLAITSTSQNLTLSTATSGTLAVTSAGALNLTSAAASTWAHSGGALAITSTSQNLTLSTATSGTLALTSAGALNLTSVAASTWAHSGGSLAINSTSQNLTLATVTSGTLAVTSAGALNLTAGANLAAAVTGTVDIQASGAFTLDSSAGAISIGGDADAQAMNWGTGAAARTLTYGNVTGATAHVFNVGTGGVSFIEAGLSNSGTNAPAAAGDALFLLSDGLSKADAASFATCFVKGAYTNTSGQVKKGSHVAFTKMFTDVGGTTYDDIAKGDPVYLAVATASAYDSGVTPAKARVTNRTTSIGGVTFLVGVAVAASGTGTATVAVDFSPQYLGGN